MHAAHCQGNTLVDSKAKVKLPCANFIRNFNFHLFFVESSLFTSLKYLAYAPAAGCL